MLSDFGCVTFLTRRDRIPSSLEEICYLQIALSANQCVDPWVYPKQQMVLPTTEACCQQDTFVWTQYLKSWETKCVMFSVLLAKALISYKILHLWFCPLSCCVQYIIWLWSYLLCFYNKLNFIFLKSWCDSSMLCRFKPQISVSTTYMWFLVVTTWKHAVKNKF